MEKLKEIIHSRFFLCGLFFTLGAIMGEYKASAQIYKTYLDISYITEAKDLVSGWIDSEWSARILQEQMGAVEE